MPIWLALLIAVVLTVASAIFLTLKGLEAFRAFKRLGRNVGGEIDRVMTASEQIERHLALAADSGTRLDASLARLRASRAQLNVLTAAIADVRAAVGRVTGLVPRK